MILYLSKRKMVLSSLVPERDFDMNRISDRNMEDLTWRGKRSNRDIPTLTSLKLATSLPTQNPNNLNISEDHISRFLISKALSEVEKGPSELLSRLDKISLISEIIHIFRPWVYGNDIFM